MYLQFEVYCYPCLDLETVPGGLEVRLLAGSLSLSLSLSHTHTHTHTHTHKDNNNTISLNHKQTNSVTNQLANSIIYNHTQYSNRPSCRSSASNLLDPCCLSRDCFAGLHPHRPPVERHALHGESLPQGLLSAAHNTG